jgi:galactokinase
LEFIGNHVDYNRGPVIGAAIDRGIEAAAAPRSDRRIRVFSEQFPEIVEAHLDHLAPLTGAPSWANYPLGVAWSLAKNGCVFPSGFDLAFAADLPVGSGLSSSAAIELATAIALGALFRFRPDKATLARWCRQAENDFVGMPCGILDQGVSAFGRAGRLVMIDCRAETFSTLPLPESVHFWVFNTGKKHALLDSLYAARRRECEAAFAVLHDFYPKTECLADVPSADVLQHEADLPPAQFQRALHVTQEVERVRQTALALERGDLVAMGRLLIASHRSSRELFENSCAELDFLVEHLVHLPGVLGARLSGGGFGGAVMAVTEPRFQAADAAPVAAAYAKKFGHAPAVFDTRTGDGARVLTNP